MAEYESSAKAGLSVILKNEHSKDTFLSNQMESQLGRD